MKKINIDVMDETFYVETLSNGLTIYMLPDNRIHRYFVTLTTRYGAIHDEFIPSGSFEMTKFPTGIAHFLEHQMFETGDDRDLVALFEENGAKINAFTSHECTTYLFGATDCIKENVNLLLELVYNLNITDETVEKEKGIIVQELKMYQDKPSSAFHEAISQSLYVNDNRKMNVGGTIEDVKRTTRSELELCYNTFYNPSNMFMIVTGNFEPSEIITIVNDYMNIHSFNDKSELITKKTEESKEVASKYSEVKMQQAETSKLAFSIKIPLSDIKNKASMEDIMISATILFNTLFGPTSILNEELVTSEIINTALHTSGHIAGDYLIRSITCETNQKDVVIKRIENELKNLNTSIDDFEMIKKMDVSSTIRMFSNIEDLNETILFEQLENVEFGSNFVSMIKDFKKEAYDRVVNNMDLSNTSVVYLTKE